MVVLLAGGGAAVGLSVGGFAGAVTGTVTGGLAGVAAGYVPVFQDRVRQRRERLEQDAARQTEARRLLAAASEPRPSGAGTGPSVLLRPERAVVEFTGRESELALLRGWCGSGEVRSVQIVAGAGGVGKTRLALRVAEEWQAAGREAVWVAAGAEAGVLDQVRAVTAGPVLLVADYAETRDGLGVLLRAVLDDPGPVRVLLLARSVGEWRDRLAEESAPPVARLLPASPVLLDAPVADVPDADLAAAAVPFFASALGVPPPAGAEFGLPPGRVPVLVLHAAALVAVLRSMESPLGRLRVAVTSGVLGELLQHEARYWRRTAAVSGLTPDGRVLKAVVASLILLGAEDADEAEEVAGRVPDLAGASAGELRRWGRWLSGLYPAGADGRLGLVQPDLLAEHHAVTCLAGDPVLARAVLSGLDGGQAVQALTVLARAWELHEEAGPVIEAALCADLAGLAVPAAEVAIATQPRAGAVLAEALEDAPATVEDLARIAEALPYPSVAAAGAHLAVVLRIRRELPPGTSRADAARWAHLCGVLLSQAGRLADALPVTEEAVALYRELAAALPDRYNPDLARSLTDLGIRFSELGRRADALPVTEEAVALYRELAALPRRYNPDLARSLTDLGIMFLRAGPPGRRAAGHRGSSRAPPGAGRRLPRPVPPRPRPLADQPRHHASRRWAARPTRC